MADFGHIVGKKFGRLLAKGVGEKRKGERSVITCICDCGSVVGVLPYRLTSGNTKSCGCLSSDLTTARNKKNGCNKITNDESYCYIRINGDIVSIIDLCNLHIVENKRWRIGGGGYCVTSNSEKRGSNLFLHKIIMGNKNGFIVDHINRNKLDNRISNLRFVTAAENSQNQPKRRGFSNKYKGVKKRNNKYHSRCRFNGVDFNIGSFSNEDLAAYSWNLYAKLNSDCASLNELPYDDFVMNKMLFQEFSDRIDYWKNRMDVINILMPDFLEVTKNKEKHG